jgi:hypothetical protein
MGDYGDGGCGGWGGGQSSDSSYESTYDQDREAEREYRKRQREENNVQEIYRDIYGTCVHCKKGTERRNTYCTRCGKKWDTPDPVVVATYVCPNGHGSGDGPYCGSCGAHLVWD